MDAASMLSALVPLAPPHWTRSSLGGGLPVGLPDERQARMAARRAFVAMKDRFTAAVRDLPGENGHWLRERIRAAEEPFDLWLLRIEVLGSLPRHGAAAREMRAAIDRALSNMFAATSVFAADDSRPGLTG